MERQIGGAHTCVKIWAVRKKGDVTVFTVLSKTSAVFVVKITVCSSDLSIHEDTFRAADECMDSRFHSGYAFHPVFKSVLDLEYCE